MRTQISYYLSDDETCKSVVSVDGEKFIVEYYENGRLLEVEEYTDKSIHFVEDAAENFVLGVKKFH